MSEKEKVIMEKLTEAIPRMSEYDKGYLVGLADGCKETNKPDNEKEG